MMCFDDDPTVTVAALDDLTGVGVVDACDARDCGLIPCNVVAPDLCKVWRSNGKLFC